MSNKNCGPDVVKYFVVEPSGGGGSVTGTTGDFYVCSGTTFVETISGCTDSVDLNGNTFYNSGEVFFNGIISACTGIHTSNIFGCSPITVHDEMIFLSGETITTIERDDTLTQILARDSVTGKVKYRDVISIITGATSQDTFVTGATLSASTLILSRNDGVELTTDLSSLPITDLGKILFVSETGDDSTGTRGDINKPFRNLYGAKSASTSGDTVYVFPGTWTYDNTATAGKPYDDNVETLVNLWKDGVNYYFSPNSKVVFINQGGPLGGSGGDRMYLFRPPTTSTTIETCNIYGGLDFQTKTIGPNSSGGYSLLFDVQAPSLRAPYNCNMKINSAVSEANQVIEAGIYSTGNTQSTFNFEADTVSVNYLQGQSGNGGAFSIVADGDILINIKIKNLDSWLYGFYIRSYAGNRFGTKLNIELNQANTIQENFLHNFYKGRGTYTVNNSFVNTRFFRSVNTTSATTVINATLYNENVSDSNSFFELLSGGKEDITFNGDIYHQLESGVGKRVIYNNSLNTTMNFRGNVIYDTVLDTTRTMIEARRGVVNFEGNVNGNFANTIVTNRDANVTINNSNFRTNTSGSTLIDNPITTLTGITSIINSTIVLDNSATELCDGQYLNTYVFNSNIKNRGTSDIFTNSTNTGLLQVNNSSLVTNGNNTINISGNSPLIAANLISNTSVIANNISGIITELTELDIE
jgi:hypothetical protein